MDICAQRATTDVLRRRCGPRCKCTLAEKRAIVEEMRARGASVAGVARRDGVNANLLFGWIAGHFRQRPEGHLLNRHRSSPAWHIHPHYLS